MMQAIFWLFALTSSCMQGLGSALTPHTVPIWGQCGGVSDCYYNMSFSDKPWSDRQCGGGMGCSRVNQYYWQCTPQDPLSNLSALITGGTGDGMNLVVPARKNTDGSYDYGQVLNLSLLFYEAQRVGKLPKNNRIKWRGDAFLNDRVVGGWLDAGDNMRFNFPMSWAAGVLAWSLDLFKDAYKSTRTFDIAYDNLRWASDYFMQCYISDEKIVAQLGDGHIDHARWTRPEYIPEPNPVYYMTKTQPGSDLAGSVSGFLGLFSKVARDKGDIPYSSKLLDYSKKYYSFATKYRGKYSASLADAASFYPSATMYDDLAWGALCLYHTTKEPQYLIEGRQHIQDHWRKEGRVWHNYDWDSHAWGALVFLVKYAPDVVTAQRELDEFTNSWLLSNGDGYSAPRKTPKGLSWFSPWGSLRHSANAAFLLLAHDKMNDINRDSSKRKDIQCFAHRQIRYMLGSSGRSFVVGYGENPPMRPHHRASSCPLMPSPCDWTAMNNPGPNPAVLYGALVGGPDFNDNYKDNRADFVSNEVAVDYNAGFTGALAGLSQAHFNQIDCK